MNPSWKYCIQAVTHKAVRMLNFIKCTLYKRNSTTKATAYMTLIQPILGYTSVAWDPYQQYLVDDIERI